MMWRTTSTSSPTKEAFQWDVSSIMANSKTINGTNFFRKRTLTFQWTNSEAHNSAGASTPLGNETGCAAEVAFANRKPSAGLKWIILLNCLQDIHRENLAFKNG